MSEAPCLLIDAGNSRIKWALVDSRGEWMANGAFEHEREETGLGDVVKPLHGALDARGSALSQTPAQSDLAPKSPHDAADARGFAFSQATVQADPAPKPLHEAFEARDSSAHTHANKAPNGDDASITSEATAPATPSTEAAWSALPTPSSVWISNVAGASVQARIERMLDVRWPDLRRTVVRAKARQCGVVNGYTAPERLGSDRWSGMIGARAAFPGEHLLIATLGTATTLEALRADGTFIGGLIAPGWSLMMQSLGSNTAQLPTLDAASARAALDRTASRFATDTAAALSAGCLLAQASLIERAWHDLRAQWQAEVRLVLGGGAANEIAGALSVPHTRHDSLVLSGLALIARDATAPISRKLSD